MDTDGCLGADDPLPGRPHRVLVSGASGAGKTTLAVEIGRRLGVEHVEIDALHWADLMEPPLRTFLTDPEHIVRWSWQSHPRVAPRILALRTRRPDLPVVRLRSWAEVRRWSAGPLAGA